MMGELYSGALREGRSLVAVHPGGRREPVPVAQWRRPVVPGDLSVLDRCIGRTLDVGCGPGRMALALRGRGRLALGIDINQDAIDIAVAAGALVHRCSVFGPVPGAGTWDTALLIDGNIGIGGAPTQLLLRLRVLLVPGGTLLVEVDGPQARSQHLQLQLASGDELSLPFAWASVAIRDVSDLAALAGYRVHETWAEEGRWFVALKAA